MTAEIGILNMRGLALAADSAVTVSGNGNSKVYNNANKIFTLGGSHSLGIMIFGNADLMGVPWEVLIKTYREEIKDEVFDSFDQYIESFFDFINQIDVINNLKGDDSVVISYCMQLLSDINDLFDARVSESVSEENEISKQELEELLVETMQEILLKIETNNIILSFDKSMFSIAYSEIINNIFSDVTSFDLENSTVELFRNLVFELSRRELFSGSKTGLVIAGYGKKDLFPKLVEYSIDGFVLDEFKFCEEKTVNIFEGEGAVSSQLVPFAQQEMVHTVLTGMDPNYKKFIVQQDASLANSLKDVLELDDGSRQVIDEIFQEKLNDMNSFSRSTFSDPVISTIDFLPVSELATMAETFVNLTSFKRKFTYQLETVGGPIDVLVISKGEGPIWIKRKHYFDPELNHNFFKRG